jgi:alpha-amylase/alpha-mannosidase (GH57 family)
MPLKNYCIHAHFYQPPREDPYTGEIPVEAGASPFPNWNERIHAECYSPNAHMGNFEKISFNIGPTLCDWMSETHLDTIQEIAKQDRANVKKYGVGNAIAQPYNHTILPLATSRDKTTQIAWGMADFEFRFGRKPQGMWLPETAVDTDTLSILADHGIEFTILAPWQADCDNVDPTEPYRVNLPGGRSISVFFYHSGLSGGISFNPSLTVNADDFAKFQISLNYQPQKLQKQESQMILVASDGELYGHHQPLRDHFLAHLVDGAGYNAGLALTFPALWLKENPPRRTIGIKPQTSWSCHHGIGRWLGTCACNPDSSWKATLYSVFNQLVSHLDSIYLNTLFPYIPDVWQLRNDYSRVLLGIQSAEDLIAEKAKRRLSEDVVNQIAILLLAQYERQRMFTSCGYFFEDFDRIEPRNNVIYAAQAVWLTRQATGIDLQRQIQCQLRHVVSRRSGLTAEDVFQRHFERVESGG